MNKENRLRYLATLNRLWDATSVRHDRKQAESIFLDTARLTVELMMQPAVFRELQQGTDGMTLNIGFFARYLLIWPTSSMGTRMYKDPPDKMPAMERFFARLRQLLDYPLPRDKSGRLSPATIPLSPDAFNVWRTYHDEIEHELRPTGTFEEVADFAAKSAENAGPTISYETMNRAVHTARWYLYEALRVMDVFDEPQTVRDAKVMEGWLTGRGGRVRKSLLQGIGPSPLRDKGRRDAALDAWVQAHRARVVPAAGGACVELNPQLLPG